MHHDVEMTKKGEAYALRHNPTGCPVGIEPRLWRKAVATRIERHLALVTALLALVDGMDGDCDLEDNGDLESSLGGLVLRGEVDLERDDADDEPSLGWRPMHEFSSQAGIANDSTIDADREDEFDGREPDADLEPSLGSPEIGACTSLWVHTGGVLVFPASQERWANGTGFDEEEAVDEDGDEGGYAA